ncbi:major facilitator superfamily domain-containing protein [Naematelia encephala]|uniref:Major facilitator superfamily domain-containing protein n=1 Tax=Naematelia encephala TaxID=71784 RepID=A0A1Y2BJ47_9TREE|nr:major facilitator superfamily domain-containing protein [Naematelia encephala]
MPIDDRNEGRSEANSESAPLNQVKNPPIGVKWRSSTWYITLVVAAGTTTDALTYNIVVPVLPYRLEALGYSNISSLTSWLFFSYSMGIFLATFPVAYFFHKYPYRRVPLIVGVLLLEVSLVLFMAIRPYWVMVVTRFMQGACSTVVWTVGFALICENVEEKNMGRQIGFAVSGVSIGTTIAPPIGGALYQHLGWYSPFIFCIIVLFFDLVGRILVIEQKDLPLYGIERGAPTINEISQREPDSDPQASPAKDLIPLGPISGAATTSATASNIHEEKSPPSKALSPWGVLKVLAKQPRGVTGICVSFAIGILLGALDPTLTLRIETVWNKDSAFVGLVYLAATAPTFICAPITGHLADKYGSQWVMAPCLFFVLPWLPLLLLTNSLAGFIVYFAIANTMGSCAFGPVGLELAMAARGAEGISEIHQFAAMNLAFSISTAIGSIVAGQMYDHLKYGWGATMWFCFGFTAVSSIVPFCLGGSPTLLQIVLRRHRANKIKEDRVPAEGSVATEHA